MKKKLLFIILPLFMLLLPFNTNAITKINFNETSNGVINTTIHFDEGFVGGLDVVFKVSDNVKVKNFEFNSAYKSYTKKYSYDAVNHTLRIIVTTGGIGSSHNLLNSKRELTLGKITFETSYKTSVDYSLDKISLMYNDNNWKSTSIPDAELKLGGNSKFTYVVNEEVPPKEDEDKDDNDKEDNPGGNTGSETKPGEAENQPGTSSTPSTGNNSGTTNGSGSTSTSKTPNGTTGSTTTTDKNTPTTPNEGNGTEDKEEDTLVEPDEYTPDMENESDNNDNNTAKSTNKTVLIISIIAIILVVGILIMVYLSLKNKKSDIDF